MELSKIDGLIYVVRGRRVMLDSDLAGLYGVETKQMNRAVRRNSSRFPEEFGFVLTADELEILRCQIGTSSWGGRRYSPMAFTEHGVVMLSSILNSERASQVNVEVVRAFVRAQQSLAHGLELAKRLDRAEQALTAIEREQGEQAAQIHEVFAAFRRLILPPGRPD